MRPSRVVFPFKQPFIFRHRPARIPSTGTGYNCNVYTTTASSSSSGSGSESGSSSGSSPRRRYLYPLALVPAGFLLVPTPSAEAEPSSWDGFSSLQTASIAQLLRTWLVYSLVSFPGVVDYSPKILTILMKSPLRQPTEWFVRNTFYYQFVPGETVEDCIPSLKAMRARGIGAMLNYSAEVDESQLQDDNINGKEARHQRLRERRLEQVMIALEKSGEYERSLPAEQRGATGFALKVTGIADPNILERASYTLLRLRSLAKSGSTNASNTPHFVPYPGTPESRDRQVVARTQDLSFGDPRELFVLKGKCDDMGVLQNDPGLKEDDLEVLSDLWYKLRKIGEKAKENGVALIIDAEHTWYQPALDAYTLLLSEEFNKPPKSKSEKLNGPLIYGTYQSYLCRQPTHLTHAIQHAEAHGYALGLKLVRGAYYLQERKKWLNEGRLGADPIWPNKAATDASYDGSISTILTTLSSQLKSSHPERALSVIFGTHNSESCDAICDELLKNGLAEKGTSGLIRLKKDVRGKVRIAQLYGMKDDLTDRNAARFVNDGQPVAFKYIAYGRLEEVMPFLGRRAFENKSLMSGDQGAAAERKRVTQELRRRYLGRPTSIVPARAI
ncbi:proline dehydrogenase [Cryptococcus bacillisporus CA1873]|uniref:Proline dehydrogenase n=1 Tax=Cryptococcus bacillisporus CA1873 TaxID=1296111 RepID=A0ABR5B5D9_CRYGA|nr:proline dehydrogenase [Cryptococcus bacillisporus CA1873]|eukprot:KIR58796.1 proline dehydrogenase [Cryptococcus gattii CA1873]